MKKNESNFKKAINELLSLDGSSSEKNSSEEVSETGMESEAVSGLTDTETVQTTEQPQEETPPTPEPPVVPAEPSTISASRPAPEKPVYEAVITPDVVINGNIIAGSNLKILGKVFGNVDCEGTIVLSGNIEGDVKANKLQFMAGGIQGNVSVRENITANKDTQVKGDVRAQSAVFSGNMQGELIVRDNLELRETSTVLGNIKARGIAIYNGSRIKGMLDIGGEVEEMRTEHEE